MSGKKISEMTAITGAQLDQTNDVVPVLDVSDTSNPNKKISIQELASVIGASGTTNVSLVLDGSNNLILTDSDANIVSADLSSLLDNTDTTNVSLSMNGNNLELTDSAANTISVDLSQFLDDTNTTNASLSLATNTLTLTDSASNSVDVDLSSLDNSGLTLADVTANGAVTEDAITINNSGIQGFFIQRNGNTVLRSDATSNNGSIVYYRSNIATYAAGINSFTDNEWVVTKGVYAGASNQLFKLNDEYATFTGTSHIQLTSGTTAERPTIPSDGMIRFNTTTSKFEGYDGTAWIDLH